MLQKLFQHKLGLSILAGITTFLAFPPFDVFPLIFVLPLFFSALTLQCRSPISGFIYGFLTSFIIMLGGFYWVTYVIHVFGYLPWSLSVLMYMGFCGFGALNFPIFSALASFLHQKIQVRNLSQPWKLAWFLLLLPSLFTLIEFLVPKLFPWYISHCLYRQLWLIQIAEITGCTFISFIVYCTGDALLLIFLELTEKRSFAWKVLLFPCFLWLLAIGFSLIRLNESMPEGRTVRVALVQANIGSLEKVEAQLGLLEKVHHIVDTYKSLSEQTLIEEKKPDLIVWPETAMPFQLNEKLDPWSMEIFSTVKRWNVTLLTGAYSDAGMVGKRDYNAAFLLEPKSDGFVSTQIYRKNILLAFGEYMPFGDTFPILYQWWPQVSNFARGEGQNVVEWNDGTRFGITICYEAIVPAFFRDVIRQDVHAVINLTNDSWFGPTSEPLQHGALSVFRAVETRVPLIRVANTGISFTVDVKGRMSRTTGVYEKDVLISDVLVPRNSVQTFYVRYGDLFIWCCGALIVLLWFGVRRSKYAPFSS